MKKTLGLIFLLLPVAISLYFYLSAVGAGFDGYSLSVAVGVAAFMLICNQLLLASRPSFLAKLLGTKLIMRLHAIFPAVILALAGSHLMLKKLNGFGDETLQARLGSSALVILAVFIVITVLFMANTVWLKIPPLKALKEWVYKKLGFTYKAARLLHNVFVLAVVILAVHVAMASSSELSLNPAGIVWMGCWFAFTVSMYIRYRVKGRK